MMHRTVALVALAQVAMAMEEPSLVALQGGTARRLQRTGAVQSNVCGLNGGRGDRLTNTNGHSALSGTIHDDATDEAIDCTAATATCGQAGGSSGYADNADCHKTLVAPEGSAIELLFSSIALEADYDFVTVYDGSDFNAPVIGHFTGTELPPRLVSTGSELTVRFQSDTGNWGLHEAGVTDDPGFYADWEIIQHVDLSGSGICAAPAVYTDPHGTIRDEETSNVNCQYAQCGSGTGNAGYDDNTACYTSIHAPEGEQVRFTFTQMNLELHGCTPSLPNGGCPDGGCDYVEIFDGDSRDAPVIGRYSGYRTGAQLPSIISTGNSLYIHFITDTRNCGIDGTEDPGWFADWDFVENGQNICEPDSAVLRSDFGVLRDDDPTNGAVGAGNVGNGYMDSADCGVRVRGGPGSTINFHLVQMNLEGPVTDAAGRVVCPEAGCDYLEVFDGRDATAPLLAHWTGQPTDSVLGGDSVTSTGRDMYLHFTSDVGNYGIEAAGALESTPGFYGEWQVISDGQACDNFRSIPGTALVGHNSEKIFGTPEECMAACCARPWCKSFDYIQSTATMDAGANDHSCNLADVDASTQMGSTVRNPYNTLYEKPVAASAGQGATAPIGTAGCAAMLTSISTNVNHVCCPEGGCSRGVPNTCNEECATIWMPFAQQCSEFVKTAGFQNPELLTITAKCEREEYGRYKPGSNHGRCSDSDIIQFYAEFAPACCGPDGGLCPGFDPTRPSIVTPMQNGQPTCSHECATFVEEFHSECHPRIDGTADEATLSSFLAVCQGIPAAGGGHRRAEGAVEYDNFDIDV